MKRIAIGSDHAGFDLKTILVKELSAKGYEMKDLGTDSSQPVDYPSFCIAVGLAVVRKEADWGIVLGGSGQGEQIAANKVDGVRAALCHDPYLAELARQHNNANVLSMGGRIVAPHLALEIIEVFANTPFDGGRHQNRIDQITQYEMSRSAK